MSKTIRRVRVYRSPEALRRSYIRALLNLDFTGIQATTESVGDLLFRATTITTGQTDNSRKVQATHQQRLPMRHANRHA